MSRAPIALLGGAPVVDRAAHRHWPELGQPAAEAVARVLERGVLSGPNAPESVAFEAEFAAFVDARHALLTHSGTSALHLALACCGIGTGDHVIVPAYSFIATALAVLHAGAIPIFADVDADTGLIDPQAAAAALTPRTRALMPVHVHGAAANLAALSELAHAHGLALVEDAAQAHGASFRGRPVGALGSAGGFSLQSSKNLGVGEGGVFVTNDAALAETANRLRNFGQDVLLSDRQTFDPLRPLDGSRALESLGIGWMYRGNELTAALGRAALAQLPARTAQCQMHAERLSSALAKLPGVLPPRIAEGSTSVHHKLRIRIDVAQAGVELAPRAFRDLLMRALRAEGLEVVLWQTGVLPEQALFHNRRGFGAGWPWSADTQTDFDTAYDPARFPRARALLDSSFVLFSQSCPLIAQDTALVDGYAEAFARVWEQREALCAWAKRATDSSGRD
jgi:perosamine synthetase